MPIDDGLKEPWSGLLLGLYMQNPAKGAVMPK
jgi:hypothetical protein